MKAQILIHEFMYNYAASCKLLLPLIPFGAKSRKQNKNKKRNIKEHIPKNWEIEGRVNSVQ